MNRPRAYTESRSQIVRARLEVLFSFLERHGFVLGLILVTGLTLADDAELSVQWGRWLKEHHAPNVLIGAIFFFSGLSLEKETLYKGVLDLKAVLGALSLIFLVSPLWALALAREPLGPGLTVGLFLVASMPTTLSSGVVLTGAAGGNMATALLITIVSNSAAVFVTPFLLEFLVGQTVTPTSMELHKTSLMITLVALVFAPLALGMSLRAAWLTLSQRIKGPQPSTLNTFLVLCIVWIGVCGSRHTMVQGVHLLPLVVALSVVFHGGLLLCAFLMARALKLSVGRREAVIFMGGQKTLPLSVLIQTAVFPQYGEALVFCVCHHVVHLVMDGCVLSFIKNFKKG
ncbi:MAG: bile acid:sodium symporter [Desulfosoma sp.]